MYDKIPGVGYCWILYLFRPLQKELMNATQISVPIPALLALLQVGLFQSFKDNEDEKLIPYSSGLL